MNEQLWKDIKAILKKNTIIREVAEGRGVTFDYGYIHSRRQVRRLLKKLEKTAPTHRCKYDPEKDDLFVFLGDKNTDSSMRVAVFGDIDQGKVTDHNCVYYTARILKNDKLKAFHKAYFKINKKIPLPAKPLWDRAYTSFDSVDVDNVNVVFVFMVGPYHEETYSQPDLLNKINHLSERLFCTKVMYLVDPVDKYINLSAWFPYFDYIATYSKEDSEKYGLHYIDSPCATMNVERPTIEKDIQIRCIDSGRGEFIEECCNYLEKEGVSCDFHVQSSENRRVSDGMEYTLGRKTYKDTVIEELGSNVILEVLIPGVNSGPTLRYKESIIYNKKLITNNVKACELPCFDSAYMKIIQKPSDIDVEWLKERTEVKYDYHGEFSVDQFCDSLMNYILNSERQKAGK